MCCKSMQQTARFREGCCFIGTGLTGLYESPPVHQHCNSRCFIPTGNVFQGGEVEAYRTVRAVDYPRDLTTDKITAAVHPQLQVQYRPLGRDAPKH